MRSRKAHWAVTIEPVQTVCMPSGSLLVCMSSAGTLGRRWGLSSNLPSEDVRLNRVLAMLVEPCPPLRSVVAGPRLARNAETLLGRHHRLGSVCVCSASARLAKGCDRGDAGAEQGNLGCDQGAFLCALPLQELLAPILAFESKSVRRPIILHKVTFGLYGAERSECGSCLAAKCFCKHSCPGDPLHSRRVWSTPQFGQA